MQNGLTNSAVTPVHENWTWPRAVDAGFSSYTFCEIAYGFVLNLFIYKKQYIKNDSYTLFNIFFTQFSHFV